MKTALIIGLGISGKAAAKLLLKEGYKVIGVDRKVKELSGINFYLEDDLPANLLYDLVILSPGIAQSHPVVQEAKKRQAPVIGEIELAMRYKKGKVIGITGTNGKTTVTSLLTHVLNAAGISAVSTGNIGNALSEVFSQEKSPEVSVLELSSYQLETLTCKGLDFAIVLNITKDHLDRYESFLDYAKAKARIQRALIPTGKAITSTEVIREFGGLFQTSITFGEGDGEFALENSAIVHKGKKLATLPLHLARHDKLNALAAFIPAFYLGVKAEAFLSALKTFQKPPHRMEFVCEKEGVEFYDDSKATNVDAVIQAVKGVEGSVTLIAGGDAKGASFISWGDAFGSKVKNVLLLGLASEQMAKELALFFNVQIVDSLEQAVAKAESLSLPGEKVLLSPGCSSLDMFRSYRHRGQEFQRLVRGEEGI